MSAPERRIVGALMASEAAAVSADSVLRAQPMSRRAANQLLARLHRKGWLQRLKRGLYTLVPLQSRTPHPPVESAWPLAMRLFEPCYVSGWSAAEHWDLTEQIFNDVCVVTGRPQRRGTQEFAGIRFRTKFTPPDRIFGTTKLWFGSQAVEIADPHRLLIDILDAPELGGGGRQTLDITRAYWSSPHRDPAKLLAYAKRLARGTVFKRLGFSAELCGVADAAWLEECRSHMTSGVSRFDPAGGNSGRIVSRWNLKLNLPVPAS
ncbi:MAG: type IV toxin-antitoxin system AbiEi family antitoxin domain-containing protein [Planctomycetota bacterium]|nr:type IV toxin-antitoxin system AbiEi family antitoxin domain-containing protein [Planctomycetota bacterium]